MSKRTILNGRVASKAEFDNGDVIFYVPDEESRPFSFGRELPLQATVVAGDFALPGTVVSVVQAEEDENGHVVLGVTWDDGEGVCALEDIELGGTEAPGFSPVI